MFRACRALLSSALLASLLAPTVNVGAQEVPPRSTADIFRELKVKGAAPQHRARDAEGAKAALDAPEPDGPQLFPFLMRRSQAQAALGDREAQKRDLLRAMQVAGSKPELLYRAHGALYQFEVEAGSQLAAREHAERQLEIARALRPPLQLVTLQRVVYIAGRLGDRPAAERAMLELDGVVARLRRRPGWEQQGEYWISVQERARGRLHELHGNLAAAEQSAQTALGAAERYYAQLGERAAGDEEREVIAATTGWIETVVRDLASYQSRQGKLLAAELSVRKALQLTLKRLGFASGATARALQLLARIMVEQGRYAEGEALAREALRAAQEAGLAGSSDVVFTSREALGNALALQAHWAEAVRVFAERAGALQAADPKLRRAARAGNFSWALALIKTGDHAQARRMLAAMRARFETFGDASGAWRVAFARGFMGLSYAEAGEHQQALEEFRASVPQILETAFRDQGEEREGPARIARLSYILEGYMRALAEANRRGAAGVAPDAAAEIFRAADFARGSHVQRALSAGASRAAARDPALLRLVQDDEQLRDRVTVLSGVLGDLASAPEESRLAETINRMRAELAQIERQRKGIRERIAREFPDYAALISPKPVTLDEARSALRPGAALLSIYLAEDRAYVWGVARGRDPQLAIVDALRGDVAAAVARLRRALDVGDAPLERFPVFNVSLAHSLYARLVAPVASALEGADTLLVVPHGALGQLPFGVLVSAPATLQPAELPFAQYRAVPWLARSVAVVHLPAVSSLVTLSKLAPLPADRKPFIGYGDPQFSKDAAAQSGMLRNLAVLRGDAAAGLEKLPPLPDTREEVREIARVLRADQDKDVFVGAAASKKNVDAAHLSGRRVVVFATHGLLPGDLDGLTQPALALSNPAVTGVSNDGLLTMEEILGLRLNADWVVLSACNTAAAGGEGEEAVSGLGRAFFFAGARALLVSNWAVETVSARLLTTDLFRRQAADAKLSRAQALRQAMLQLIDAGEGRDPSGKVVFSYAHPMFWAPFSLVGDGG